ncbi:MAG: hypothetical protein ACOC56_05440 [Atribacterota bacterium]
MREDLREKRKKMRKHRQEMMAKRDSRRMSTRKKRIENIFQRRNRKNKGNKLVSMEFCTTATCRHRILDRTYASFTQNIFGVNFRESTLYLNIDPVPDDDPQKTVNVAKRYFKNVVVNIPNECNFSKAVQWGFSQPKKKHFFYLQDDWVLSGRVKIKSIIDMLGKCVYIERPLRSGVKKRCRIVVVNLRAYSIIRDYRICFSPGLFLTKWAKYFSKKMDIDYNPEKQLRPKHKNNPGGGIISGLFVGLHVPQKKEIVSDIGRDWMIKNNIYRNDEKIKFNKWVMGDD